jgi:peptidoglycan/xylan/chitin deacetylase (PgdA/CDA1 family)
VAEWSTDNRPGTTEFSYRGLVKLLRFLDRHGIKATFFVTGYFAEREKAIVKEIHAKGHEIACYSYNNEVHNRYSSPEIHLRILKSKTILESLIREKVAGFRMPYFYGPKNYQGIVASLGFKYDSSSHPAFIPGRSHNFLKTRKPHELQSIGLLEIPVTVYPAIRIPLSMPFMRTFGTFYSCLGIELNAITEDNIIVYSYPWEFIALHKMKGNPFLTRNTGIKFERNLDEFVRYFKRMHYRFDVMRNIEIKK